MRTVAYSAVKLGTITCYGYHHFDDMMMSQIADVVRLVDDPPTTTQQWMEARQGFIDDQHDFMTREEAFEVAILAGQVKMVNRVGTDKAVNALYSEDIF